MSNPRLLGAALLAALALFTPHTTATTPQAAGLHLDLRRFHTLLTARPTPTASRTTVRIFAPYDAQGYVHTNLKIVGMPSGSCWEGSLMTDRADAYRCTTGNYIHDPCFASAELPGQVACADSPTDGKVLLLHLTAPLPSHYANPGPAGHGQPWVVTLTDGETCEYLSGATMAIGSLRMNYGCTHGEIFGLVDRRHQPWRARIWHGNHSVIPRQSQLQWVTVRTAWF